MLKGNRATLLRELVLRGPSCTYDLRHILVCGSAQRARDSLLKLAYIEVLSKTESAARGKEKKVIFRATRLGIWIFLCTLLETPEEMARAAVLHASELPLILGKWDHFVKTGVSDIVVKVFEEIPPWIEPRHFITLGEKVSVEIGSSKDFDHLAWTFYSEAENILSMQEKHRWNTALMTDKDLLELSKELKERWKRALESELELAKPDLRVVSNKELAREGSELFKNAKVKEI